MFLEAYSYEGSDLSGWDVSKVQTVAYMFNDAKKFNGDLSWHSTRSLDEMNNIFWKAESFNWDVSTWDVSR
eukprot:684420-Rhodomonas_salina.1